VTGIAAFPGGGELAVGCQRFEVLATAEPRAGARPKT
jgi:hypothetical protein